MCQDRQACLSSSWFNIDRLCDRRAHTRWHLVAQVVTRALRLCPAYFCHSPKRRHDTLTCDAAVPHLSSLVLLKPGNSTTVQYNCVAVVCIF